MPWIVFKNLSDEDLALVADALGTYRFGSGWQISPVIEGGKFRVKFDDGNSCPLLTEDRKTFACEGDVDHVEIVPDGKGAVTHVLNLGVDIGVRVGK
jgi:hypothetical protein